MAFNGPQRFLPDRLPPLLLAIVLLPGIAALIWRTGPTATIDPAPTQVAGIDCDCETHQSTATLRSLDDKAPEISALTSTEHIQFFAQWMRTHGTAKTLSSDAISNGLKIATQRKKEMLTLMKEDPERALQLALNWHEHRRLPDDIQSLCETPFSTRGDFHVFPVCGGAAAPDAPRITHEICLGETSFNTTVFGSRLGLGSKEGTPLQGFHLDDRAVLRPDALQQLSSSDVAAIAGDFPVANRNQTRDFFSDEPIQGAPVIALGGGMLFHFAHEDNLQQTNERLANLDKVLGPHTGATQLFQLAASGAPGKDLPDQDDSPPPPGSDDPPPAPGSAWTTSKKRVFYIRVDFSDNTGESISQAALEGVLNTTVSDSIRDMSYGKTWIEAEASSMVVRMPYDTSFYLPNNNTNLLNHAKVVFSGLPGTGINLSNYDIVGVHFRFIGMESSTGLVYGGLGTVGGGNNWLQGITTATTMIHEFGHNYGLNHASFWDTGGTSVIGAGSSIEYGNTFDIMGSGQPPNGHFQTRGKQKLSWIGPGEWQPLGVPGTGTYRLYRGDHPDTTGIRAIRIPKQANLNHYYWLGYRRNDTSNPYLPGAVMMNWDKNGEHLLMDTTPGSSAGLNDAALALGKTYSDTNVNIHVTPVDYGGTSPNEWVDVTVNIANNSGNQNPTAILEGPSSGTPGNEMTFSVDASDPNGNTLAYHWDFGDGTMTTNEDEVDHTWGAGGNYTVTVSVTDMKGGTVTDTLAVTISDPRTEWTIGNVGFSEVMSDAKYLNGRYILTGDQYAYFSLDGLTWSRSLLSPYFTAGGIAYGGGIYVVTGRDYDFVNAAWGAAAFYSSDGKHWTRGTVPLTDDMLDVTYGNGRFVAIGYNGSSMYSLDGMNWAAGGTAGTLPWIAEITFGNGEFLVGGIPLVAFNFGNQLYASSDGLSWVERSATGGAESHHNIRDLFFADGKFFNVGYKGGVRYSSDQGATWQGANMPVGKEYSLTVLHIENGVYVALGTRVLDGTRVVIVSNDGLTWHEALPNTLEHTLTLTMGNGILLSTQGAVGHTQFTAPLFPDNLAPTTSISAPPTAAALTGPVSFTATSNDPDGDDLIHIWDFQDGSDLFTGDIVEHDFITGGTFNVLLTVVDGHGGLTTSTHPITVDDPRTEWTIGNVGFSEVMSDAKYLNGRYILTGDQYAYFSLDGLTWSRSLLSPYFTAGGIAYGGGIYVVTGRDYDFVNAAWGAAAFYSSDGKHWTRGTVPLTGDMLDVTYGNGRFVAIGYNGSTMYSLDGMNWTAGGTAGTLPVIAEITFGNGEFLVGGTTGVRFLNGNKLYASPDGLFWVERSATAGVASHHTIRDLFFADGKFFNVGYKGGVRYSSDQGATWQGANMPVGKEYSLTVLHIENGVYIALGTRVPGGTKVVMVSDDGLTWQEGLPNTLEETSTLALGNGILFSTQGAVGHTQFTAPLFPDNLAPTTSISAPTTAAALTGPVSFTATSNDPDGDDLIHIWDFQDGSDLLTGDIVEHDFITGGTFNVLLTVIDGHGGLTTSTHPITVDDPLTWAVWRPLQFPGSPPNSGPYDDFDGDRIPNLIEFITGTDPTDPNSNQAPALSEESGYMVLTIDKASGIAGFTLQVEASDNLVTWNTTSLTVLEDNSDRLKVRLTALTTEIPGGEMYLRANAVLSP